MAERKYSPDQPRDERGRFGSGGGGAVSDALASVAKDHPGNPNGTGTLADPIYVDADLDRAAREIYAGNHVRLDQKEQVSTLVDKLGEMAQDAVSKGEKAPTYDLGKVTVPGTNLFTQESLGIPRVDMPQLAGKPLPGTPADAMPKDANGRVNLGDAFRDEIAKQGYQVTNETVPAENLRATQMDLIGPTVAGMSRAMDAGTLDVRPIYVSKDNYILDGHHNWAATVLSNIRSGKQGDIPVQRVNADIGTVLDLSRGYTRAMGLPQKAGAAVAKTIEAITRLFAHLERKYHVDEVRASIKTRLADAPVDEPERPPSEWTYDSPGSSYGDWDTWLRVTRRKVREMRSG